MVATRTTAILAWGSTSEPFSGTIRQMGLSSTSIAHVRLTVTDIERSRRFYECVFGWPVLLEVPDNADEATRDQLRFLFGGVVYDLGGTLIGLRPVASDRFDEEPVIQWRARHVRAHRRGNRVSEKVAHPDRTIGQHYDRRVGAVDRVFFNVSINVEKADAGGGEERERADEN